MLKLKLDLDKLVVESFDTNASGIETRGTVRAHSQICTPTAGEQTCGDTCGTCYGSCPDTCYGTCGGCSNVYTCGITCNGSCFDPSCNTCYTNCQQDSCVIACP